MADLDTERVSAAIGAAASGPGGVGLVVSVLSGVSGVIRTPARRGLFHSEPERIQIGDWRYEVGHDGLLSTAHVVNGIVLAQDVLPAATVGTHVARALGQLVARYGDVVAAHVDAAVDALAAAAG
jgi:hypothetical protein